jgi:hypothetical protein
LVECVSDIGGSLIIVEDLVMVNRLTETEFPLFHTGGSVQSDHVLRPLELWWEKEDEFWFTTFGVRIAITSGNLALRECCVFPLVSEVFANKERICHHGRVGVGFPTLVYHYRKSVTLDFLVVLLKPFDCCLVLAGICSIFDKICVVSEWEIVMALEVAGYCFAYPLGTELLQERTPGSFVKRNDAILAYLVAVCMGVVTKQHIEVVRIKIPFAEV